MSTWKSGMDAYGRARPKAWPRIWLRPRARRQPAAAQSTAAIASVSPAARARHHPARSRRAKRTMPYFASPTAMPWAHDVRSAKRFTARYSDASMLFTGRNLPLPGEPEGAAPPTEEDGRSGGAAWYYPEPKEAAAEIKDRVAFWRGVEVAEAGTAA